MLILVLILIPPTLTLITIAAISGIFTAYQGCDRPEMRAAISIAMTMMMFLVKA